MCSEFFVAPDGNDAWSGRRAVPNAERSDGPFRSVQRAVAAVRSLDDAPEEIRVLLREGCYALEAPITFTAEDFGEATPPEAIAHEPSVTVTYAAFPGEHPVISGGRRITGWAETTLHGQRAWVAHVPEVARGQWYFRQLFVNGTRRMRPRLPKNGFYRVAALMDACFEGSWMETTAHGADRFGYRAGDIQPWQNLQDVEINVLTLWVSIHARVKAIDDVHHVLTLDRNSRYRMTDDQTHDGARYYVSNVFEALETPGEWYLDRPSGKLYYLPLPGETLENTTVIAPRLPELMHIEGDGARRARQLHFDGVTFAHTEWWLPDDLGVLGQAATAVPGAVRISNAAYVRLTHCSFAHLATIGVEVLDGSYDVQTRWCDFHDLGAGGVRIWHGCKRNTVADCEIGPGGLLFPSATGVVIGQASGNQVLHNHIHDFTYSGISVGWTWGYGDHDALGNVIEYNHIHDIGHGLLSDMAGIYTLGVSTGTRIRYNVIHDVRKRSYGGWGIYPDEGSSELLIEGNLCYRTHSSGFHQHYGKNNLVRNNIFAFGEEHQLERSRVESHCSFTAERNIFYFDRGELLRADNEDGDWSPENAAFRANLYFDASGRPLSFSGRSWEEWQALGMDASGRIADPLFVDPAHDDFRLRAESPAYTLGFQPLDLSSVGPRTEEK